MRRRFAAVAVFFAAVLISANLFAASKPFRFGVIGDNRSGDRIYTKIVEAMMRYNPDFVINTGDLIPNPGNRDQWKNFWELSKPISCPYYLAPGNHDIDDRKSQSVWRDEVRLPGNETYYSWVRDNNLFVVLNTCDPDNYRKITGVQWAWLKKTLGSKRKYDHKFVILHHPLYMWQGATHYGKSLDKYPKLRDELHELFKANGVDIVFAGHEHTYRRMEKDGIKYIVTGGAGARLYSGFNNLMIVDVDGDFVSVKVYDKDGAVRDRFMMGEVPVRKGVAK